MRKRLILSAAWLLVTAVACGPLNGLIGGDAAAVDVVATLASESQVPEEAEDNSPAPDVDEQQPESVEPTVEDIEEQTLVAAIDVVEAGTLAVGSGEDNDVIALDLSPDGTQLAVSGAGEGAIYFIDTATGTVTRSPEDRTGWGMENVLAYNPSGTSIVVTNIFATLAEFDTTTLVQTTEQDSFDPYPGQDTIDLVWADNTSIFALVNTGEVAQVAVPSAEVLNRATIFESRDVRDLSQLANGNLLAIGADVEFDQTRAIVEITPELNVVNRVPLSLVRSTQGSPDGSQIALHTGLNGQVFLVNNLNDLNQEPEPIGEFCNDSSDIAWSPDSTLFAITATRCSIQVYDAINGQLVYDSNDQRGGRGVAFSPDGTRLYVGTDDRGIQVYEIPVPEGFVAPTVVPNEGTTDPASPVEDAEPDPEVDTAPEIDPDEQTQQEGGDETSLEFIPIPQNDAELEELPFAADAIPLGTAATLCIELLPEDQLTAALGQSIVSRFNDDFERFGPAISCLIDLEDGSSVEVVLQRFPSAYDAQLLWVEEQYFFLLSSASRDVAYADRGALLMAPPGDTGDTPALIHFYLNDYYVLLRVINPVEESTSLLEAFGAFVAQRLAAF